MKTDKALASIILAIFVSVPFAVSSRAQDANQGMQAANKHTRQEAAAMLARVSREVWHAQGGTDTAFGQAQQNYIQGEKAYFHGHFDKAMDYLQKAHDGVHNLRHDVNQ